MKSALRKFLVFALLAVFISPIESAHAVVTASGPGATPSVCNQIVGDEANVVAYRLAGGDCVIEFKKVGTTTWSVPAGVTSAWVVVVGGGGGGAYRHAGGGGAGGVVEATNYSIGGTIGITVGAGGAAATNGSDSRFFANNESTAGGTGLNGKGGGRGDFYVKIDTHNIGRAGDGGSGGGSAVPNPFPRDLTTPYGNIDPRGYGIQTSQTQRKIDGTSLGSNFSQYGNNGAGGGAQDYWAGGGGGGAGAAGSRGGGVNGTDFNGGAGGIGIQLFITGTATYFGGGGGGGAGINTNPGLAGDGGSGGGGAGSRGDATATAGTANTGGGGGGGGVAAAASGAGAAGGSGIVLVRYTPDVTGPTFTNSTSINFAENTATSTNAATISVSESATITITSGSDGALFNIIFVDSVTARIRFIASPNFESPQDGGANNVYDLSIRAVDTSGNGSNQAISITVTNVNELPSIANNGSSDINSLSRSENATAVETFAATDIDASPTFTWTISGTDSGLFTIASGSGVLAFASAPNFENASDSNGDNAYIVIITVSDGALTDSQTVTVTVTDGNDAPTITINGSNSTHAISIAENGTSVLTYTASDVDAGTAFAWSISGVDAGDFLIDTSTGVLAFTSSPDFEDPQDSGNNNGYVVIITVSDGALIDTQTLTVTITNLNESGSVSAPSISGTAYKGVAITVTVTSNSPGKIRFFVGGKRIANCLARSTTGNYPLFTATCSWKPSNFGAQLVSAQLTPSNNTFTNATSAKASIWVFRRSGTR